MTPEYRHRIEWYAGAAIFIAFITAHQALGARAAVQVIGVACVATGLLWMLRRSVPVGIEARPPSFHLAGWGAILAGLAMLVVGLILLVYSAAAVCVLGWGAPAECP